MSVNHYDDLDMEILSLGRSYKAPSHINQLHVKIKL
jgi:hypothetical protein